MANANRDSKRKPTPYSPQDFHPYSSEDEEDQKNVTNELTEEQIQQIAKWQLNPSSV